MVVSIEDNVVHIDHRRIETSANIDRVQSAPESRSEETAKTSDEDDKWPNATVKRVEKVTHARKIFDINYIEIQVVHHDPSLPVTVLPLMSKERQDRRTEAQIIADKNKVFMYRLPDKRTKQNFQGDSQMATLTDNHGMSGINNFPSKRNVCQTIEREIRGHANMPSCAFRKTLYQLTPTLLVRMLFILKKEWYIKSQNRSLGTERHHENELRVDAPLMNIDSMCLTLFFLR